MAKSKIEVEAKARVADPERVERLLSGMGSALDEIDFADAYYVPVATEGYSFHRFRLRRTGERAVVTAKQKVGSAGVEANREHEFEVSDPEAFDAFARLFGFKVLLAKRKHGRRWKMEPATVELIEVDGLGHFVEVEILIESESEIEAARNRVIEILQSLGVDQESIEPAPYTQLLYQKLQGQSTPTATESK